jgi:hypothetical protein
MVTNERYSPDKLEKLHNYLNTYFEKGEPLDFEILVDGFRAVRRTNDPELFQLYEDQVNQDTECITVMLYTGSSRYCDKRQFFLNGVPEAPVSNRKKKEPQEAPDKELNGLPDTQSQIQDAIKAEREKWRVELLEKENIDLKKDLQELLEENEDLSSRLNQMLAGQSPLKSMVGEFGSVMVESFIRRNPQMLAKIPGGSALSGLLEADIPQLAAPSEGEAEISFAPKTANAPSVSEEEKAAIEFVGQLQERFTEGEFNEILAVLECFAADKTRIKSTLQFLNPAENHEQAHI